MQQGHKHNPYLDNALDDYISHGGLDKRLNEYGKMVCEDLEQIFTYPKYRINKVSAPAIYDFFVTAVKEFKVANFKKKRVVRDRFDHLCACTMMELRSRCNDLPHTN
ncbi:hypothetical protein FACS1894103_1620 [Campylobacterota bacterium]|nr:hypothetical protein FACS1894103_1620 [Campylobacterota bacterium]